MNRPEATEKDSIDTLATESVKLSAETSKQLTTLNAGSIIVIGTFLKDIFPTQHGDLAVGPGLQFLIAAAFVFFGLSLLSATYTMIRASWAIGQEFVSRKRLMDSQQGRIEIDPWADYRRPRLRASLAYGRYLVERLSLPLFTVGQICFGLAVVLNLYR